MFVTQISKCMKECMKEQLEADNQLFNYIGYWNFGDNNRLID